MKSGLVPRQFRTLPIGGRAVFLTCPSNACAVLTVARSARPSSASPMKNAATPTPFERYALELLQHATIKAVANHLGVGWDAVKEMQKRRLHTRFSKPKLKHLKRIAIDEISIGRGHRYLTVVLDLGQRSGGLRRRGKRI